MQCADAIVLLKLKLAHADEKMWMRASRRMMIRGAANEWRLRGIISPTDNTGFVDHNKKRERERFAADVLYVCVRLCAATMPEVQRALWSIFTCLCTVSSHNKSLCPCWIFVFWLFIQQTHAHRQKVTMWKWQILEQMLSLDRLQMSGLEYIESWPYVTNGPIFLNTLDWRASVGQELTHTAEVQSVQ